jgi:Bacterial Ig-like domain
MRRSWARMLAAGLMISGLLTPASGTIESRVEPRFDLATPESAPFPSDRFTVADATQRTGLRVALPLPDCRSAVSVCEDVRLLNELDGFDLSPRLALPFSGAIDLGSVTARSVFVVRLGAGPPEAVPVSRLVHDPGTRTLYARPDALLEPETRYGLVVTREVRDARGRPIQPSRAFHAFLRGDARPALRRYRGALRDLVTALGRRGVRAEDVAVGAVFTTGSATTFLEHARAALDARRVAPALMTAPETGGWAYFPRGWLTNLVLRRQVGTRPDAPDAFADDALPLRALAPDAVGGVGVGWYLSPWYLTGDRRIIEGPTTTAVTARLEAPVPFVIVLPAGAPPLDGWPVAIMGHGYGGEMFSNALLIAGTLARHGVATVAITVVGHGGGPEGRLVAMGEGGANLIVRVPGRGIDQNGDGRIERVEGLEASGSAASLALRDGLRQQVVDLMTLVRALRGGLDVDGDGRADTRGDRFYYVGQSLGGIYGTLFLAVEPRVEVGVLNVPGGSIPEIVRLAPVFRPLVRQALARRTPSLLNAGEDFREDLPLRGDPPVVGPSAGALTIQEYLARVEWLGRRGDPLAYARHLRVAPLAGQREKRVLLQVAWGDGVVPNPTTAALVRVGQLGEMTSLLRADRVADAVPAELAEPHGFLLRAGAGGVVGAIARAAQEQVARFFRADGERVWDPDEAEPPPFREPLFEVPASAIPDRASVPRGSDASSAGGPGDGQAR